MFESTSPIQQLPTSSLVPSCRQPTKMADPDQVAKVKPPFGQPQGRELIN